MIAWLKRTGPVQRAGIVLVILAGFTVMIGSIDEYGGLPLGQVIQHVFRDFYANLSTKFGSTALTVFIIDSLARRYIHKLKHNVRKRA
jgi:hypothetical protein